MIKRIKYFLPILFIACLFFAPQLTQALDFDPYGAAANVDLGQPNTEETQDVVVNILNIVLGFLALIAMTIIMVAGFYYMFSGGDPEKMKKAKNILLGAIIGLVIIFVSWGITVYVIKQLGVATTYSADEVPDAAYE